MSGAQPQGAGIARPAQVNSGMATQNIVSPSNPFVDPNGILLPVSFRYLWGLFQAIEALEDRLNRAGIPP